MTTTTTTYRLQITQGIGYTGKTGCRAYVAAIVGTSDRYGLDRQFLDADSVERDSFTRTRYIRTYTYELAPGLYEVSEHGERRYLLVYPTGRGTGIGRYNPLVERVETMARLMADGQDFEAARLATRPPKKTSDTSTTV